MRHAWEVASLAPLHSLLAAPWGPGAPDCGDPALQSSDLRHQAALSSRRDEQSQAVPLAAQLTLGRQRASSDHGA